MNYGTKTLAKIVSQLGKTIEILDRPQGWVKNSFARTAAGKKVGYNDASACSFCMAGAMMAATDRNDYALGRAPLYAYVAEKLTGPNWKLYNSVVSLNDKRSTTHEQVMFALDFTLAQAKDELKAKLKK